MARGNGRTLTWALALLLALTPILALLPPGSARASTLPAGFQEEIVFGGLTNPTAVRFAPDGRVFVAEKSGLIKVFDNLDAITPAVVADLNVNVYNFWDRGLLGLALDPAFPASPYVYVLYTHDAAIGGTAPRWGTPGVYSDPCPTPPGPTTDGCVVSGRLSRLQLAGNAMTGAEQVLVEGWCQQFPSHSVGALAFGPDGALYASAGDGASFTNVDYGQYGGSAGSPTPKNPCGDPPGGVGGAMTPPTAEGGALRSQSPRRPAGEPVVLNGAVIRVDPATGAGWPDNPLAGSDDANARRVVAYGLRNPFRITTRPNTSEVWIGDVGWNDWEEIDRIVNPTGGVLNFGWPCYEGSGRQGGYDSANLDLCETLYGQPGAVTAPYFAYHRNNRVVPDESCPTGSAAIAGLAFQFYAGGSYPAEYDGALFFADNSRDCIWAMLKGADGLPAPGQLRTFVAGAANPVDLQIGPGGDLFYVDFDGGTIRRIRYVGVPPPPEGTSYLSDLAYTVVANGWGPVERDMSNGEQAAGDGRPLTINGATYAKGLGAHAASDIRYAMNGACSTFAAQVGVDDEVGANGSVVFQVWADGAKLYDSRRMTGRAAAQAVSVSVAGKAELRLVVTDAGDGINYDHADWADARLTCGSGGGGDTTAPTVTGTTPQDGATGVATTAAPTATFSEAMDPATLTATTVTLAPQGTTTPVEATVSYDDPSRTVTLRPSAPLAAGTAYTATVRGGPGGAKDLAGNPLAADQIWSFTTAPGNAAPTVTITSPAAGTTWKVGDRIDFSGSATDPEDGLLPASALSWKLELYHCPSNCHTHPVQTWTGVAGGSFAAPDHEYPSYLQLELTATDSGGLKTTATLRLDPQTVVLTFQTNPGGLQLAINGVVGTASFTRTVIVGSRNTISAPSPQTKGKQTYEFVSWSDGGAQTHDIIAPASATTYTARFRSR